MAWHRFVGWLFLAVLCATPVAAQDISYGVGTWDRDSLGNHRVVIHVAGTHDAVRVHIPWRRRDADPEGTQLIVRDAKTHTRVANVARVAITRAYGDLAFQPTAGAGDYFVYFLPYVMTGRNYPTVRYPSPDSTADPAWLSRTGLRGADIRSAWERLPAAHVTGFESADSLDRFTPMEIIATAEETAALVTRHPTASFLLFPEDRTLSIRMPHDLPQRWIFAGAEHPFTGDALRGEFYAFQVGLYAVRAVTGLHATVSDFRGPGGAVIAARDVKAFNFGGTDWTGRPFARTLHAAAGAVQALWFGVPIPDSVPAGAYTGAATITSGTGEARSVSITLRVQAQSIAHHGDDDPWRLARLRWLDSQIAADDDVAAPYTAVTVDGQHLGVLGRRVTLDSLGLPSAIESFFHIEMTRLADTPRAILRGPAALVMTRHGAAMPWSGSGWRITQRAPGVVRWTATNTSAPVTMHLAGSLEFDGTMEYAIALTTTDSVALDDIRLELPFAADVARYMLGMGRKGGTRPDTLTWTWDVKHNQEGAWLGDVNAGLQFLLRDERYERPLNTNFYLSKPLILPRSWDNDGRGGCHLKDDRTGVYLVRCFSGPRTMTTGDTLWFNVRLTVTPFRPIDPDTQWRTRFYHRYSPLDSIQALGANVVNVHHATPVNPFINYPFLRVPELKAYVDSAHARDMKIKIYYTVRELSNSAPELFALKSLGDEILSYGPGGGAPWLQEHLDGNYIAGWYVPELRDAAVVNSGVSRWHNFYLEGLNWLVRNTGIDGLYIDDVAFDRTVMKRVRKILDRGRPDALIDLHSANQFNVRDGFANSANLYLEHFPYIDRLWFGEYFDYHQPPDYWLTEVSGIPFGLMGEMLQDGGNPWRGMLFGMTNRLPWAGDPRPLWKAWDDFGMVGSRMMGYWVPNAPVKTDRPDVLATSYVRPDRVLVSLGSWATGDVTVRLDVNWSALGMDPARATITAPAIDTFQDAATFAPGDPIPVPAGKGWLLVIRTR
jgi:Glycoside hydrolase 123, N-terminal domain